MDRLEAMTVFSQVVEQGSFARAADRLGLSASAVSRQLADLEEHLGVRLLNRTTRRLSLTESGQVFLQRTLQLLSDVEEAEAAVGAGALVPRGTLRLTCPTTFGERHVAPAVAEFGRRHPELKFDVELSDRVVDIVEEGIDLAIRIGAPGGQALVARRIGQTQLICCAAPSYLRRHGTPRHPRDLAAHRCLAYAYLGTRDVWRFIDRAGNEHAVRIAGPVHANSGGFLAAIATSGAGIALEPDFIVGADIERGALKALLTGFAPPATPIHAVYASRRHLSAKVRAFVDFMVERFAGTASWLSLPAARTSARAKRAQRAT